MDFLKVLAALADSGAPFVIVGGVAARLYGSTRLTHDLDIIPRMDRDTWSQLIDTISQLGGRPRIPEPLERIRDLTNVEARIADKGMLALSFRTTDGTVEVDLLVAESPRFEGLASRARRVTVDGREYLVAGIDDLVDMKRRAGRPQDLLDVEQLERLRTLQDTNG